MTREDAERLTRAYCAAMSEHGFVVQVNYCRQEGKLLHTWSHGSGNILARREQARVWIANQEQGDLLSVYMDEEDGK